MTSKKLISWIVPCYNEQKVVGHTLERIIKVSNQLNGFDYEIILIDDGSSDNTRVVIKSYVERFPKVKLIAFSRNFGHQIAVQSGLNYSIGSAVIIIDADLQDPPELASQMIELWQSGFDVVYGRRIERASETFFKKLSAKLFYWLLNILSDIYIPEDTGDFRLIDKKVVLSLENMPESGRFMRGLISWCGFKQTEIKYKRQPRYSGYTKYSINKMIGFALEGITSFSTRPLKLATFLGAISAVLSIIGIVYILSIRLFTNSWVEGWATLAIATLFTSAIQLICLGILGEYVGRLFSETKKRPLYIVDETVGFSNDTNLDRSNLS
tara:strand:+ start:3000 stop:3974 length:975 start_codon:yes stop_codon:yes gene_type:complete